MFMFWIFKIAHFFVRWLYFEALFIRNVYIGFITCPSLLEAVGVRLPIRNII
jgi:hypothetical protein